MQLCSSCERPATTRHGRDGAGRQRYVCRPCSRTFTAASVSAFSGYRWPPDVILTAVRWYLAHPLSATSVMVLLAERGIAVSQRTVLRWVQTFGPLLAAEVRKHRRRPGTKWFVDEVFFFRDGGKEKRYLYRAIDEHGQVLDVLYRDHRDTASAEAFFRRASATTGVTPTTVVSDHHQPYSTAIQEVFPRAMHIRTGLHRAHGETTKSVERSHIATRDRLRSSRGVKTRVTGQRFFEGFEAVQALGHGHIHLEQLVGPRPMTRRAQWSQPSPRSGRGSPGRPDDGRRPEPLARIRREASPHTCRACSHRQRRELPCRQSGCRTDLGDTPTQLPRLTPPSGSTIMLGLPATSRSVRQATTSGFAANAASSP